MAATTRLLARSGLCVAVLNYDDLTLLASGFTVANISGSEAITFYMIVNDQTLSSTVSIGQTHFTSFVSLIPITIALTFLMAGVSEFGIGSV